MTKKNSGMFSSDRQPAKRGKSFKNKLLEVIRDEALLGVESADLKKQEQAYLRHFAARAFDSDDMASGTLLKELINKSYPSLKSVMPNVEFDFEPAEDVTTQVNQIIKATSQGLIPPDVASIFLGAVKAAYDIEASTALKERIEALESLANVNA